MASANYDMKAALQTVNYYETITCRTGEHGAIFKTLLSIDDTTKLLIHVSKKVGLPITQAVYTPEAMPAAAGWMDRPVKSMFLNGGSRRTTVYHD